MKESYLETIALVERLHRQCMEVVKAELDRLGVRDLNAVQAMVLFNLGERELTVGELTQRGYYLGSNVKKLVELGYLLQQRSPHDKRATHLRCSDKGLEICRQLDNMFDTQANELANNGVDRQALSQTNDSLQRVEGFWAASRLGARPPFSSVA